MPTSELLPPRHLALLGEVWDLCIEEGEFKPRELSFILAGVKASGLSDWCIVEDQGTLMCRELEEDLDYLHRRGFLFRSSTIIPTASAAFALQAAGVLEP